MDARTEMLARIRAARAGSTKPYDAIDRSYLQGTTLDRAATLALFENRLQDYGAGVWHCALADIGSTIENVAQSRGKQTLLISDAFPQEWLPRSLAFIRDEQLPYEEIDRIGSVLTTCALAIAETGTIVLRHSPQEGRRALTLIPDYHLCVVNTGQVVASVVEGIRRCEQFTPIPLTTISGPSATSDIEMTRIKGVHGPRTLDVLLLHLD